MNDEQQIMSDLARLAARVGAAGLDRIPLARLLGQGWDSWPFDVFRQRVEAAVANPPTIPADDPQEPIAELPAGPWLRVNQALKLVPVGKSLLYRLIDDGTIRSTKIAGCVLIDSASLQELLQKNAKGGQQPEQQKNPPPSPARKRRVKKSKRQDLNLW